MVRVLRAAAAVLAVLTLTPALALAQADKAGVVTTLEGNVTVTRVALPQGQPLKFKDDVFVQDKIVTGDQSIARMLLGGKAVVTVRERSSLTITQVAGKATIDLDAGKIALAVAKDKMRPGESIEVRTANAVAGVRGTVLVAEVSRATAQLPGGPAPALVTTFSVLNGQVDAFQRDAVTGQIVGPPVLVGTLQQFLRAGFALSSVVSITPQQVQQIVQGLSHRRPPHTQSSTDQTNENGVDNGITLASTFSGNSIGGGGFTPPTPVIIVQTPINPCGNNNCPQRQPPPPPVRTCRW